MSGRQANMTCNDLRCQMGRDASQWTPNTQPWQYTGHIPPLLIMNKLLTERLYRLATHKVFVLYK